jgi:AraC-like DNA-binding protein
MPTPTRRIRCLGLTEFYTALESLFPGRKLKIDCSKDDICRYEIENSSIGDLHVVSVKNSLPTQLIASEKDNGLTLVFVQRGSHIVERGGACITANAAGGCSLGALQAGDVVTIGPNCERQMVYFRHRQIDDVIARHFHVTPPVAIDFPAAQFDGPARDALDQLVRRALIGVETAAGPFGAVVSKQYSDLLVSSLLLTVPNSFSSALGKASEVATTRYVRRALDYIRANVDQPIDIDDIARNAACSPRRLQLAFRAQFGLTPIAFLKEERLQLAERRLRTGEYGDVTSLALSLGFSNLGRFAGEFRQKFGVLPSEILGSQPTPRVSVGHRRS